MTAQWDRPPGLSFPNLHTLPARRRWLRFLCALSAFDFVSYFLSVLLRASAPPRQSQFFGVEGSSPCP